MSTPWAWASLSSAWTFPPIEASTITGWPFGHHAGTTAPEAEPRGSGSTRGGGGLRGAGALAGAAARGLPALALLGGPALVLLRPAGVGLAGRGGQPLGPRAGDLVEGGGDVGDLLGATARRRAAGGRLAL